METLFQRMGQELRLLGRGLRRGLLEVALTTYEGVSLLKQAYRIHELEREATQVLEDLGRTVYRTGVDDPEALAQVPQVRERVQTLQGLRETLREREQELARLREADLQDLLMDLAQALRMADGTLEQFTIPADSPWVGQTIQGLKLPPDVRMVVIRREEGLCYPQGETRIQAGDQLFLVGPRRLLVRVRQEARALMVPEGLATEETSP